MNVGEVCKRNVVTVRPFDELAVAAGLMREKHVGFLIVVKSGLVEGTCRPIGVLTNRDIVIAVVARGVEFSTLRVEDAMTPNPVTARAKEPIEAVLPKMRKAAVRRVPVLGARGELVGVLSFDDVFDTIAESMRDIVGAIRGEKPFEASLRP